MNNREILKAVLEKAINQGYTVNQASFDYLMNLVRQNDEYCNSALDYYIKEKKYYDTIFSHDFAKAFWGNKEKFIDGDLTVDGFENVKTLPSWKYHLQKMVLEKEPLKYLEKFLKD